ncbi:MAG: response regulator, partial [Gemmataceae bacterium]|nr:response regulator [Gemmataceae bacterium]
RVLLVEDNAVNQFLVLRLLERSGHRALLASDGQQAVEAAARQRFDVVLMDWQLPGMDGGEATRRIRRQGSRVPIIALTAHALPAERERCLEAGCDAVLTKPFRAEELAEAIARAVPDAEAFRLEEALEQVGGSRSLMRGLVELFLSSAPESLAAMERADEAEMRSLAHKLRGSASVFGASAAAEALRALEHGRPEELGRLRAAAAARVEELLASMRQAMADGLAG